MTLYTVVVCSECQYARVVPRQPKQTTCGRCQTSKAFRTLKHYYQTEDKRAAAHVRARVQARADNYADEFEQAVEDDLIFEEVESVISDDEYLRKKGADTEAIEAAEERAEGTQNRTRSKREIMGDAISNHGESRESVREYAAEHDISPDWVDSYLDRARAKGMISGSRDGPYRLLTGD